MTWHLVLGDPAYSSWSLRGWLLFHRTGLPVDLGWVSFFDDDVAPQLAHMCPARTVPCARAPDGAVLWDSLALAEELATRHPDAGLWPGDPAARATARSLTAEMHSGFASLRAQCPMNLRLAYDSSPRTPALAADLARLQDIWAFARGRHGSDGPWLCGAWSIADAFFAPVAARIAGYALDVGPEASAYVATHLADASFRDWWALAQHKGRDLPWYFRDYPQRPWPLPAA